MRSQASKPLSKKGALGRTTLKESSAKKQSKKKTSKKVKNLSKSLLKSPKRNTAKDEKDGKKDDDNSPNDKIVNVSETVKAGPSKPTATRSDSPTKKCKKELKEKKDTPKTVTTTVTAKKVVAKKAVKPVKNAKSTLKLKQEKKDSDVKYKINLDTIKKNEGKFCKAKSNIKKGSTVTQRKKASLIKQEMEKEDIHKEEKVIPNVSADSEEQQKQTPLENKSETCTETRLKATQEKKEHDSKSDTKPEANVASSNISQTTCSSSNKSETQKHETERPPKFFTSSRSPRMVDIDVKCCKNSKGNLSVSERFLSMKCETKPDDSNKDKPASNTLVSQESEIDVYTFTEKVDSPKNILTDFRNPINKNIGRVRPIARVKGTVIDKKGDVEKKKYSPHRPIEEVVKQLKANKRSEEFNSSQKTSTSTTTSEGPGVINKERDVEEPTPIVSKSYKMVARKSSITGKPFSPIKFFDQEPSEPKPDETPKKSLTKKKTKTKKQQKKSTLSDEDFDTSKFSLNTKTFNYTSSDDSVGESNDDNDFKESSDTPKTRKVKTKKYKKITDGAKKSTSKELKELSKDSLIDLKDNTMLLGNEKPTKRRLKLLSMWAGPKKHRMASLNALAKVHCLYENESRTHLELGLMKTIDRPVLPSTSKTVPVKKKESKSKDTEKLESTSESEYENKKEQDKESSESSDDSPPQRTLRGVPGIRSAGKYWDPKSSTSSSEDSELESKGKGVEKKKVVTKTAAKSDSEKPPTKVKKTTGTPGPKKKRNRNEVVMDLKDMVVQKRMASLNATAILAASYEKRSPKSNKEDTTSDSCSDESFVQKPKNVISSGVKSEVKKEDVKKDCDETIPADKKQKVEVIVNQDTDVTITGVYSTHHHEGFCTVSGMQYRISSTSHTQTTATANCEKEGCSREDGSRYTPLSALSSMQPPAEHAHTHTHPVPEIGGLSRRAGCSSAFSAPSPAAHHEPGKSLKPSGSLLEDEQNKRYYQPAGPLIKESSAEAERALARYHPTPHYHPPHPSMLHQYGSPYYPSDLCYGRYYRPPGSYHMPPTQPEAQMVGVGSEPYPPPQYYGTPPCYQHSPQRIPYVEYRGCPCPMNACPKNVLIGPATGKAPTGGGPADVPSALAPPGGAFRAKVRACALDSAADTHGSGKDPPLEPEPPAAADAPHPCPLPTIGGASPKRELFDRDNMRLAGDVPGPAEALGPPSPARGSAGVCTPQPPPVAPRRARLGKAMARRSLAGDDTGLLLNVPQPPPAHHSDADDDVLAISPPICAPIDLSSSDERSTPLVDVKKENEGPTYAAPRKADAQALKEHNSSITLTDVPDVTDAAKAVKRRYSKPKLEIEMKDVQLDTVCKTNGIGEHVKLQKRRKVSGEQTEIIRTETVSKEPRKKSVQSTKRTPRTPNTEKKTNKRKAEVAENGPKAKKVLMETDEEQRLKNKILPDDTLVTKPKTKSALLLDNLIRKNSIDRVDAKGYSSDNELNPAKLFLPSNDNVVKKTLNINNNIVENTTSVNGVRPKTIAAVSQHIEKKLAFKNACKVEKIDSKITHSLKSVLKTPTDKANFKEERKCIVSKSDKPLEENNIGNVAVEKSDINSSDTCKAKNDQENSSSVNVNETSNVAEDVMKTSKKPVNPKSILNKSEEIQKPPVVEKPEESQSTPKTNVESQECTNKETTKQVEDKITNPLKCDEALNKTKASNKIDKNGECKGKNVEKLVKLLVSKKQAKITEEETEKAKEVEKPQPAEKEKTRTEKPIPKRCKLSEKPGEMKGKNVEKVAKLMVSKKTVLKTNEAALVVEDACATPPPTMGRRCKRRRSGGRRIRRALAPLTPPTLQPRAPPRWSNGWNWDGEHYISKVYLNNDSRMDRTARCWSRMTHASGDRVARGDCVLLRASLARAQPFVARIASLWENPDDGEMMVSLVWYYRPEHTQRGRTPQDAPDEVFASRHRDANSVACIEDKCYVLTFNEYCRYRKRLKASEEGIHMAPCIVPPLPAPPAPPAAPATPGEAAPPEAAAATPEPYSDTRLPPSVAPDLVLFCRKVYDFRSKKLLANK
ncbi:uncharacterized protein Hers isoform X2 [Epargyreus clarus]|uniref:uncharacterized protein Hers isoform X2 n=1 Tax=Epargyreus clarus TaxID=520877 RepID=UPI003C2C97B6